MIGAFSILGCVNLGREVLVASRVSITSGKNQHYDKKGNAAKEQILEPVSIGEASWIGEGAVVMANVGRRCIISAGSVVTKDAPDDIIAVGNPARFMPRNGNNVNQGKEQKTAPYKADVSPQPG